MSEKDTATVASLFSPEGIAKYNRDIERLEVLALKGLPVIVKVARKGLIETFTGKVDRIGGTYAHMADGKQFRLAYVTDVGTYND